MNNKGQFDKWQLLHCYRHGNIDTDIFLGNSYFLKKTFVNKGCLTKEKCFEGYFMDGPSAVLL